MYKKLKLAWPFLLPGLAGLLIFYGIPFVGGIWYSVTEGTLENKFVGLDNYISVWNNTMFQMGLKNTMELSLICAPLLFLLSFLLAAGLHRIRPAGGFFRSSVLMPYLMPSVSMVLMTALAAAAGTVLAGVLSSAWAAGMLSQADPGMVLRGE